MAAVISSEEITVGDISDDQIISNDETFQIALSESTAAERRIAFQCNSDADGISGLTGQTFSAGDLKVNKAFAGEANAAGTATEIGVGYYYYEFTSGEVDTAGGIYLRVNKTAVRSFQIVGQVGLSEGPPPPPERRWLLVHH